MRWLKKLWCEWAHREFWFEHPEDDGYLLKCRRCGRDWMLYFQRRYD